ncbi:YjaG family protein [Actinobacillus delphinicola]|uniref:D-fructose-6-phosphate amidotransferase n=1 Tax=Actinobacillus delphinicola TaxID=51161 RepID=A0A448TSE4_9PAST|nr:DUF416 family protein [Actinobacillus delphinicola]VEJ08698.1 D-fructose-6-phosphate amidotransferase [Actinobacillus delphinicola]
MRNPIHKRLANLSPWKQYTFMACLCERMYPNFYFYCDLENNHTFAKRYRNILDLVWEFLTVKNAKINFDNQLEKLENIIPQVEDPKNYAIFPAIDACRGLADLLHSIIAGETLDQAISISQLSLKTIVELLETQSEKTFNDEELKHQPLIEQELDVQWEIYRVLKDCEKHDVELILDLKNELKEVGISNIGIELRK